MDNKRTRRLKKRKKKTKKAPSQRRRNHGPEFSLFLDESGNSGLNLFSGKNQFLCCGMFLKRNSKMPQLLEKIKDKTDGIGLHGSMLGLTKIETIADDLLTVYKTINARFIFSIIDKRYYATMKLWDCLFDAGTNPGASSEHVSIAPLRFTLIAKFCNALNGLDTIKHFWEKYTSKSDHNYTEVLHSLIPQVNASDLDNRSKELITDAIKGAINNQIEVFGQGASESDSPNVMSVIMMAHELNRRFKNSRAKLSTIVHDRQDQFGNSIETLFNAVKTVGIEWDFDNPFPKIQQSKSISANLEIHPTECDELDLSDIACYLAAKSVNTDLQGKCGTLYRYIEESSHHIYMTERGLTEKANEMLAQSMSLPLSLNQLEKASALIRKRDAKRKQRISDRQTEW